MLHSTSPSYRFMLYTPSKALGSPVVKRPICVWFSVSQSSNHTAIISHISMVCTWGNSTDHLHDQTILTLLETTHVSGIQAIIRIFKTRSQMSGFRPRTGSLKWFSEWPRVTQLVRVELARGPRSLETGPALRLWEDTYEPAGQAWAHRTWGQSQSNPAGGLSQHCGLLTSPSGLPHQKTHHTLVPQDSLHWLASTAVGGPAPNCLPLGSRLFSIDSQKADIFETKK